MVMDTERMEHDGVIYAIIIRRAEVPPGVHFLTPDENLLQVGLQLRPKGTVIAPHAHCKVKTDRVGYLQEVLHIQRGQLKVVFYADDGLRLGERVLEGGDTILLIRGGHGFEVLQDTQMLEIKMGPYDPASKRPVQNKG